MNTTNPMNTTNATDAAPATLETESCSRCGGTGSYSWCRDYGSKCFKCAGKGITLTKRGQAANRYLRDLRSKRLADVVVGDKFLSEAIPCPGIPGNVTQWVTVEEIGTRTYKVKSQNDPDWREVTETMISGTGIKTKTRASFVGPADTMVRIAQTAEQKAATFAQALAYQATLTKTGTVRKARGKAA